MRTTVDLSPELLNDAKNFARARGRTLSSVLEEAMREALARHVVVTTPEPLELPVSGDPTAPPRIDILDKDAVARALGDDVA